MSAPKRWIDDVASATPQERDLLRSAASAEPPPGAQSKVWLSLLAQLPPVPPGSPPPAPATGSAATSAGKAGAAAKGTLAAKGGVAVAGAAGVGILKSALIGGGSAVALIFTYSAVAPPTSTDAPRPLPATVAEQRVASRPQGPAGAGPALEAPAPVAAVEAAPSASPNVERRAPTTMAEAKPPASALPAPAATTGASPGAAEPALAEAERQTMIAEEGRLMGLAADSLRRGDAAGALSQLQQIEARFPRGGLVQEREVRMIEALAGSGRRDEASARAAAFLRAHPNSVLTFRVQPFVK
jgi:hypothetical protein